MAVAFRRYKLLPLNDCLYAIQATIPHLTRPSHHCGLRRHGISRMREVSGDKFGKQVFEAYGRYLPDGKEQSLTDKSLNEINALGRHMRRQPGNLNSLALRR